MIKFFTYDRMLLGDIITNDENDTNRIYSYAQFREKYEKEELTRKLIEPAREFITALQYSSGIRTLMEHIYELIGELDNFRFPLNC